VGGQPVFLYDFAAPEAYLVAERSLTALPVVPEWQPIHRAALPGAGELDALRCAEELEALKESTARRAQTLGLQALRWPENWPPDTELAMLAATWCKQIGRAVAFSLAAFRQAYAGGRDLSDPDTVLLAAAACELHPKAVLKGCELRSVRDALAEASDAAAAAGVKDVPALRVGDEIFYGERGLEAAAELLAESRAGA
jgi:2-hydroxychromene-2-carboxylate isomerase